jgi:integrase
MAAAVVLLAPNGEMRLVGRRPRSREHLIPAEVDRLIAAACSTRWGVRDSTLLLMMFSHGLRVREASELKRKHLDLKNRVFHVERRKNGRGGDHRLRGCEIRALRKLQRRRCESASKSYSPRLAVHQPVLPCPRIANQS